MGALIRRAVIRRLGLILAVGALGLLWPAVSRAANVYVGDLLGGFGERIGETRRDAALASKYGESVTGFPVPAGHRLSRRLECSMGHGNRLVRRGRVGARVALTTGGSRWFVLPAVVCSLIAPWGCTACLRR